MQFDTLFSILIANYNNGHYILQAIDSVLCQTYKHWEIIIVDDCSTDNSLELLRQFSNNNKIKIYQNTENAGVGYTKKRLADLGNGELAGFLDPDDALSPNALDVMVEAHHNNPKASLVYSRLFLCDHNLNVLEPSMYAVCLKENETFLDFPAGRVSHFAVFKTTNYKQTDGINISLRMSEDMDLYYKLEETGPLVLVDEHLYYYRQHQGSVSLNTNQFVAYLWNVVAKTDAIKRRNIDPIPILKKTIPNKWEIVAQYEQSIDYKIGRLLLSPLRFLNRILRKKK